MQNDLQLSPPWMTVGDPRYVLKDQKPLQINEHPQVVRGEGFLRYEEDLSFFESSRYMALAVLITGMISKLQILSTIQNGIQSDSYTAHVSQTTLPIKGTLWFG